MVFARSLMICLLGLAAARKLPYHKGTEHFHQDCWVPDYCDPETFQYKLCRLRLRGRAKPGNQYACAEDEYCEEIDCENKCWLPANCTCHQEGPHVGRMVCNQEAGQKCNQHPSTQWGVCTKMPADWDVDHDDDEPLPVDFHFYTTDALLHNAKLHINEDSPMAAARIPKDAAIRDEL
uniref:Uncharacterized protein n=1 Tax=Phaeocystis antarctica TaxID=33657 RepID=A0A7S0HRI2_9EUKA